jgi:hypothetical protein
MRNHPMNTPKPKLHFVPMGSPFFSSKPVCGTSAKSRKTNDPRQITCQHCLAALKAQA